ncbi:MAG TPA: L,D-transpeptidase family protein [Bacteroidales bacterium]|nr:L,D-transpeptidase family protein [Bacteroidales bacterium]
MTRSVVKRVIVAAAVIIVVVLLGLLLLNSVPEPPVRDVTEAREALAKANSNRAGTYSRKIFAEAKAAYDSAMANWRKENKRIIFFRNYSKVKAFARLSEKRSLESTESSITSSETLKAQLRDKIDSLNGTEASIDNLFGRYPLPSEIRTRISNGKMLLTEGIVAFNKGQYLPASRKINEAEYLLTTVYESSKDDLKNYFRSYSLWKKWVQNAINDSRKNDTYTIIVDKFSKKCYVYLSGTKKYEFDAELGRNWVGNKHRMGDKATPEGNYKIITKMQGKDTPYHKALAIDYPNNDDIEKFKSDLAKGNIPSYSRIGGGIEIHGGGGRGVDWTEGCIALTDNEIDLVYNIVKVGTPVTIVGSLKNIDEVLTN